MKTAHEVIREALPIKCLEGVFLGALLTNDIPGLLRFPVRFKTRMLGHSYWHIVLAIRWEGKYGALGLSRRPTLEYKELQFNKLSELICEYRKCYEACFHRLQLVTVGLPLTQDEFAQENVAWELLHLPVLSPPQPDNWPEVLGTADRFTQEMKRIQEGWKMGLQPAFDNTTFSAGALVMNVPGQEKRRDGGGERRRSGESCARIYVYVCARERESVRVLCVCSRQCSSL